MGWLGYSFVDLTEEQVHDRRVMLDHHAFIAQLSVLAIPLLVQFYHLSSWGWKRFGLGDEEQSPSSPYLKADAERDKISCLSGVKHRITKVRWWVAEEVLQGWGTRNQWISGTAWMVWLLVLCVKDTGDDYMHLTKRFGIVAASQLPMHFLLAMKSSYSPLQMLTRMSHEQLNSAHRVLGKVIQALLTLHAAFYLNFFARINVLAKRIKDRDVVLGIMSIWIITIISSSAIAVVRKWKYRLFYSLHVIMATIFLPVAYFHVHHLRKYIIESAAVYVVFGVWRLVNTKTCQGTITIVPGTSLVQVHIPLAAAIGVYEPGQHVYLSLPAAGISDIANILQRNPFTVASLPQQDGQLVLVARVLDGNTKRLAVLAQQMDAQNGAVAYSVGLKIDGPYGAAAHLPSFAQFDRVLLVAGGVGATFIIPVWRSIIAHHKSKDLSPIPQVKLVWAVRSLAETKWALPFPESDFRTGIDASQSEAEVYITGNANSTVAGYSSRESLELEDLDALVADGNQHPLGTGIATVYQRPNLQQIILDTCDHRGDRIAVLVCGPVSMWQQLRHEVKRQVMKGNDIYFHAEEFGL